MFQRNLLSVYLLSILVFAAATFAVKPAHSNEIWRTPDLLMADVSNVFIPVGFDDNDFAEVVVAGQFSDNCYQLGPSDIEPNTITKTINISVYAYRKHNGRCFDFPVNFAKTVKLEQVLKQGEYTIIVNGKLMEDRLVIDQAPSDSQDDFLYAPVSEASISTNERKLTLKGNFTSTCMKLKEVRQLRTSNDVLVVLPIAEFEEGENCRPTYTPFSETIKLPLDLRGLSLIHIRVLNGESLNKIDFF